MVRTLLVVSLVGLVAVGASASAIKNGTFNTFTSTYSTSSIPNWTVGTDEAFSDQSGVYFVVDNIHALDYTMVLLTTAPDGTGTSGSIDKTTLTSDPFVVDNFRIEFSYVYVTGESAADAASGYDDPFSVSVVRESDGFELYSATVADATDSLVHSNVNFGPLPGSDNRQTKDWAIHRIDSTSWIGSTVRVVFTIEDGGDDVVNSGVFLENVQQAPEPGTLILFALGALGVGLWRRRK